MGRAARTTISIRYDSIESAKELVEIIRDQFDTALFSGDVEDTTVITHRVHPHGAVTEYRWRFNPETGGVTLTLFGDEQQLDLSEIERRGVTSREGMYLVVLVSSISHS